MTPAAPDDPREDEVGRPGRAAGGSGRPGRAVTVRAPAKVNLHLEILRQRPDGYHDIETVFQALDLFDSIRVWHRERGGGSQLRLRVTPLSGAPAGQENLCWQAVRLFQRETGCRGDLEIELRKSIPAGAGLGGGSSDAAAVLVACNRLFGAGLEAADLERLAVGLGADVPFFIRGGTQLGRGRGTELRRLDPVRHAVFLVVKPPLSIGTASVYAQLKMGLTVRAPKCNIRHAKALLARFPSSSWFGFNRLEEVVMPAHPELQRLVGRLRELAPVAMMCGSGAAVFAAFDERSWTPYVRDEFDGPAWYVRVAGPHPAGVEIMEE